MSSEGAAAASAAARPRGAASRKATLQARAPEGDIPARLTGEDVSKCADPRRLMMKPVPNIRAEAAETSYGLNAANSPALA
jgi:hypothetical protein